MNLWANEGWPGEHADLWKLLSMELLSRDTPVTVTWVMGHACIIDIARGRTTAEDKAGNDGADKLAVAGAYSHRVPSNVVDAALSRRRDAKETHGMMLAIISARMAEESTSGREADRGSELGDDFIDTP